jgi:F-box-like
VLYVAGSVSQRVTIGSLPDNVLLDIFDIGINTDGPELQCDWETLVHVCQRWRYLIFESPTRLNLQLHFSEVDPVMHLLDVWPPFPFVIEFMFDSLDDQMEERSLEKVLAALEHPDRVRQIHITCVKDFPLEEIVTAMEESEPFPELRSLVFDSVCAKLQLPATFLNGSAPCLEDLTLRSISFPSLPRLLSSTSDLTSLNLENIPNSGYIPPETMASCLSALPKL